MVFVGHYWFKGAVHIFTTIKGRAGHPGVKPSQVGPKLWKWDP